MELISMNNLHASPLVTIVIPVYNTEKYLNGCLESVQHQTCSDFEVIIVDDGSPDQAYAIAENFCKKDQRFILKRQGNVGLSGARNSGILHSKGKYILFLDSDDELVNDAIERLTEIAETDNSQIVIPDRYFKIIESKGKKVLAYHFSEKEKTPNPVDFALNVIIGKGRAWRATSVLYSSETIKQNNIIFPVGYTSEDISFNLSILSHVNAISYCDKATLLNLKRIGSITTSYSKKLIDMFLYIDEQVIFFLNGSTVDRETGRIYNDSLLCRNTIVALTYLMGPGNRTSFNVKCTEAIKLLKHNRVSVAFKNKTFITPYFSEFKTGIYFRLMFFFLSKGIIQPAFLLALIAGKYSFKS
jgi:glycosyltransferase involved in cell wall biosynthesis